MTAQVNWSDENRVYVVDDDGPVRRSLEAMLSQVGFSVKHFSTAAKLFLEIDLNSAGCIVVDLQMPDVSGADLTRQLFEAHTTLAVIVISETADVAAAVSAMENGAVTFLEKPYEQSQLLDAVRRALILSHERYHKRQATNAVQQRLDALSDQERSVMKLMLKGESNKGICRKLDLSMRTVDRRRHLILEKMQFASVPEMAMLLGKVGCSLP